MKYENIDIQLTHRDGRAALAYMAADAVDDPGLELVRREALFPV
jgi:hypothetical protein